MKNKEHIRNLIPAEPVVILSLIGLMLIGSILYYRASNLQRFLEPALAVLEPRTILSSRLNKLASEELGPEYSKSVVVRSSGLMLHKSLFSKPQYHDIPVFIKKLSDLMRKLFDDPWMASNVEMIMIRSSVPLDMPSELREETRQQMMHRSEALLNAMLDTNAELAGRYSDKFAATVVLNRKAEEADWIALDIIPSERLHIEVLERLSKYAHRPLPTN